MPHDRPADQRSLESVLFARGGSSDKQSQRAFKTHASSAGTPAPSSAGDRPAYSACQPSSRTMVRKASRVPWYRGRTPCRPSCTASALARSQRSSEPHVQTAKTCMCEPCKRVLTTSSGCNASTDVRPAVHPATPCFLPQRASCAWSDRRRALLPGEAQLTLSIAVMDSAPSLLIRARHIALWPPPCSLLQTLHVRTVASTVRHRSVPSDTAPPLMHTAGPSMSATGGLLALKARNLNLRTSHKVAAWTVDGRQRPACRGRQTSFSFLWAA
jgi:hypothetical protein